MESYLKNNTNPLIKISNSLLGKYCLELGYKTAQEINNDELIIWLKSKQKPDENKNEK